MRRPSKRHVLAASALGLALVGALAVYRFWPEPKPRAMLGPAAGAALGKAAAVALFEAHTWRLPTSCLETANSAENLTVGPRTYVFGDGRTTAGNPTKQKLRLGVVADARGAQADTLVAAQKVSEAFASAQADLVLSLGGLGRTRAEIALVLAKLAGQGLFLVVAIPGDREDVYEHRAAVAELAARGLPVVDGSRLGLLVVDGVAIAFLPGVPAAEDGRAHGLVAGADGCARSEQDLRDVAARLASENGPRVLASHRPPRQRGPLATDLALGGVHIGERALAALAAESKAAVFLHAEVDETGGRMARPVWPALASALPAWTWANEIVASTGPLEAFSHVTATFDMAGSSALIVEIDHKRIRARAISPGTKSKGAPPGAR